MIRRALRMVLALLLLTCASAAWAKADKPTINAIIVACIILFIFFI